eukprot:GHVS01032414.1.p1 GENE.GHVS01032414.1~~GHVS01032414.1.p1  ORF type:complete len:195 (-),score=32.41 GHVS01032414.1:786-1370(-)
MRRVLWSGPRCKDEIMTSSCASIVGSSVGGVGGSCSDRYPLRLLPNYSTVVNCCSKHSSSSSSSSSSCLYCTSTCFPSSRLSDQQGSRRYAHKYAPPYCPNLINIRKMVNQRLQPIYFTLKNDPAFGFHIWDMHFRGLLCSPLFEGKTYDEMNEMVRKALTPIGMTNRVRLTCQPPSLFCKMKRMSRQRWPMEK